MRSGVANRARDLVQLRHIHLQRQHAPPKRLNLCYQLTPGFHIPQAERHIRAGMSQSQ
jgi:hypothetical protein